MALESGIAGRGGMGAGMAERWLRGGHRVVAYTRSQRCPARMRYGTVYDEPCRWAREH